MQSTTAPQQYGTATHKRQVLITPYPCKLRIAEIRKRVPNDGVCEAKAELSPVGHLNTEAAFAPWGGRGRCRSIGAAAFHHSREESPLPPQGLSYTGFSKQGRPR